MYYDIRIKVLFSLIFAGASGSGKTTWLEKFLSHFNNITDGSTTKYERLLLLSSTNQPELFKRVKGATKCHIHLDGMMNPPKSFSGFQLFSMFLLKTDGLMHCPKCRWLYDGYAQCDCSWFCTWYDYSSEG